MKRAIDTSIWSDPWFTEISAPAKMVFMYLLTNERSTAAGIFDLSPRRMAFDIGIDQSTAEAALMECEGRVRWWPDHSIVWVVNFFRHQAVNDNFLKSAQRTYAGLPAEIRNEVVMTYPEFDTNPSGTRPVPVGTGTQTHTHIGNREELTDKSEEGLAVSGIGASAPTTPETKPEKKAKTKRATQIPETWLPSDSTRSWAAGEGFTDDQVNSQILRFVDYWRGKGETRKDWDATFRNWMRNAREWGHLQAKAASSGSGQLSPSALLASIGDDDEYKPGQEDFGDSVTTMAEGNARRNADTGVGDGDTWPRLRSIAGGGG